MPSLSAMLGSSSSDSGGGAGEAGGCGAACAVGRRGAGAGSDSCSDPRSTWLPLGTSGALAGSGAGVSSTSECLPVVQGSMVRNSSKVSTRGLQHFQPATSQPLQRAMYSWSCCAHLSALHGRRACLDGKRTRHSRPHKFCRSLCARTSWPCLQYVESGESGGERYQRVFTAALLCSRFIQRLRIFWKEVGGTSQGS